MTSPGFDRRVLSLWTIAAMLAGCGGLRQAQDDTELPIGAAGDRGPSWVAAGATAQNLLYIADGGADDVYVYSYPAGKSVGKLQGFQDPAGVCADATGDVWIVNSGSAKIVEYAHGAKEPKATLSDPGATYLIGCSVDPTTGDLAVTDLGSASVGGRVLIYARAHGTPRKRRNEHLQFAYFCGYDDAGNLFIDGLDGDGSFVLVELAGVSNMLRRITLNQSVGFPGGVQWDGRYIAIGDQRYKNQLTSAIYQVSVSGGSGTVEGTTQLSDSCDVLQFSIVSAGNNKNHNRGAEAIAPDACQNNVRIYDYPAGGASTKTFDRFQYPVGATVSLAK